MTGRVLVTGGAGYVGSHAAKALARRGFEPVTYDNLSAGNREAVRWGPLVEGDLRDGASLRAALRDGPFEAVLHFAANASVGESVREPSRYLFDNVHATMSLLLAMRHAGVQVLVFSSSCSVYGVPGRSPIREDAPPLPVNPYGEGKLYVERALAWHARAHGLRFVSLRYFNAAGADPDCEVGETHNPETHLVPRAIAAALGQEPWMEIHGTDYPTPDGTAIRDYVHVSDLGDAHVAAVNHLLQGGESLTLNLGTGHGYSVREVVSEVAKIGTHDVPVREGPRRPGDPPVLVADPARAREALGWAPHRSGLADIVATAWAWHTRRPGALRVRE